jgi:hypothetical protein
MRKPSMRVAGAGFLPIQRGFGCLFWRELRVPRGACHREAGSEVGRVEGCGDGMGWGIVIGLGREVMRAACGGEADAGTLSAFCLWSEGRAGFRVGLLGGAFVSEGTSGRGHAGALWGDEAAAGVPVDCSWGCETSGRGRGRSRRRRGRSRGTARRVHLGCWAA